MNTKLKFLKCNMGPAFRRLLLDRPSPMFVELFVTRRCNLKCSYCYARRENETDPTTDEIKSRVDKVKELGSNMISIMGGEPTLRDDLPKIIEYCHKKNMFVSMDTNGTLLNEMLIDQLAASGLDSMVISLDGIRKLRGSRKTVAENPDIISYMDYASKKMRVFINIVLTKENINEVIPLLDTIDEKDIMFSISLIVKDPSAESQINDKFSDLELIKFDSLFDTLIERKKQGHSMFEPLKYYRQLKCFIRGKNEWECTAGRHFFSVDTDGRFQLCCGSKPSGIYLTEMDKEYWKKYKDDFRAQINRCNKFCSMKYAYCTGFFSKNKMEFVK